MKKTLTLLTTILLIAAQGAYAQSAKENRYQIERAIVKYKVAQNYEYGHATRTFDNYGTQEHLETTIGDQTDIRVTTGGKTYALSNDEKEVKTVTNEDPNFLALSTPLRKTLNPKKNHTGKILGKPCNIYTEDGAEYYVWKGIVLRKVERTNEIVTIIEATNIVQPSAIDTTLFTIQQQKENIDKKENPTKVDKEKSDKKEDQIKAKGKENDKKENQIKTEKKNNSSNTSQKNNSSNTSQKKNNNNSSGTQNNKTNTINKKSDNNSTGTEKKTNKTKTIKVKRQ